MVNMNEQELFYLLALQRVEGVGDITAKKLIAHFGSAEAVFLAKSAQLASIEGVGTDFLKKLNDITVIENAENELKFITHKNIEATSFQDENYPDRLKHC